MIIVVLSDTHGRNPRNVPAGDVLIHCGDLTDGDDSSIVEFAIWLKAQPHKHKIFIAGNHDRLFDISPERAVDMVNKVTPEAHYLKDKGVVLDGVSFWGSPYTPTFYDWYFMKNRGPEMAEHWKKIPDKVDVLITHGPPFGHLDLSNNWNDATGKKFDDHLGCEELKKAVERVKPLLHVFGHIHGSGERQEWLEREDGTTTQFANASIMDEAYIPNHKPMRIDLDYELAAAP